MSEEICSRLLRFNVINEDVNVTLPVFPSATYRLKSFSEINSFLSSSRLSNRLAEVSELYEKGHFQNVVDIVRNALHTKSQENYDIRMQQLCFLIDALWKLGAESQENSNYIECFKMIEIALNELTIHSKTPSHMDTSLLQLLKDLIDTLECCFDMLNGNLQFASVDDVKGRLCRNLIHWLVFQIDGDRDDDVWAYTGTFPWIMTYRLIQMSEMVVAGEISGSVYFLCSAHDYLGQAQRCTEEEGAFLLMFLNRILPQYQDLVAPSKSKEFLKKTVEQIIYCLYGHPNKKNKFKHLVDHGSSCGHVPLTIRRVSQVFLFLRPSSTPEYDHYKANSISAETEAFFKRIVSILPKSIGIEARLKRVTLFTLKDTDDTGKLDYSIFPFVDLLDLFYLLADYYFKNSEFDLAIRYYMLDLSFNSERFDSWVALALSLGNKMEQLLNSIDQKDIILVLKDADQIINCFKISFVIDSECMNTCIECANICYYIHSFCSRWLKLRSETLNMESFQTIERKMANYLSFSFELYTKALKLMNQVEPSEWSNGDERWLLYFMRAKIMEKRSLEIEQCVLEYIKAMENLISQKAFVSKRISYCSPMRLSLELLEVYYRIHASILKLEYQDNIEGNKQLLSLQQLLQRIQKMDIFSSHASNETTSTCVPTWTSISSTCVEAMEKTVLHFPQHFKALHNLAVFYLRSKRCRNLDKARQFLWGVSTAPSNTVVSTQLRSSLFSDRKLSNLFNGIWRFPISELDRPGSFPAHIAKCVSTCLEMALAYKDYKILCEVAIQLKKQPDGDKPKYLTEYDRLIMAEQAASNMITVMQRISKIVISSKNIHKINKRLLDFSRIYLRLRKAKMLKVDVILKQYLQKLYSSTGQTYKKFEDILVYCQNLEFEMQSKPTKSHQMDAKTPVSLSDAQETRLTQNIMNNMIFPKSKVNVIKEIDQKKKLVSIQKNKHNISSAQLGEPGNSKEIGGNSNLVPKEPVNQTAVILPIKRKLNQQSASYLKRKPPLKLIQDDLIPKVELIIPVSSGGMNPEIVKRDDVFSRLPAGIKVSYDRTGSKNSCFAANSNMTQNSKVVRNSVELQEIITID